MNKYRVCLWQHGQDDPLCFEVSSGLILEYDELMFVALFWSHLSAVRCITVEIWDGQVWRICSTRYWVSLYNFQYLLRRCE